MLFIIYPLSICLVSYQKAMYLQSYHLVVFAFQCNPSLLLSTFSKIITSAPLEYDLLLDNYCFCFSNYFFFCRVRYARAFRSHLFTVATVTITKKHVVALVRVLAPTNIIIKVNNYLYGCHAVSLVCCKQPR